MPSCASDFFIICWNSLRPALCAWLNWPETSGHVYRRFASHWWPVLIVYRRVVPGWIGLRLDMYTAALWPEVMIVYGRMHTDASCPNEQACGWWWLYNAASFRLSWPAAGNGSIWGLHAVKPGVVYNRFMPSWTCLRQVGASSDR